MNRNVEITKPTGEALGSEAARVSMPSRRRWLRNGLKATPAVLTLASQPVLAWQCKTPSAHASAAVGSRATRGLVNYTKSPGTCTNWKDKFTTPANTVMPTGGTGELLIPYPCSATSTCSTLFGSGSATTLLYALTNGTPWEKAVITAMLNAKCGRIETSCATEATFVSMWQMGDSYSPSAGKVWSKSMVVDYLTTTGFARP